MRIFNITILTVVVFFLQAGIIFSQNDNVKGTEVIHQEYNRPGTRRAIVIGISKYQHTLLNLKYANSDAVTFSEFLKYQSDTLNKSDIVLLTDSNATLGNIYSELKNLKSKAEENDEIIIFFSGHGDVETLTQDSLGYLLCYDAVPFNFPGTGALSLYVLKSYLETLANIQKCNVIIILDACRSGKLMEGELNKTWGNIIKLLSCTAKQKSIEDNVWGGGHGAFTYCLINGLTGLADYDSSKTISKNEVTLFLKYNLPIMTKNNQNPDISGGDDNYILSTINNGSPPLTLNWSNELIEFKNPGFKDINVDSLLIFEYSQIKNYLNSGYIDQSILGAFLNQYVVNLQSIKDQLTYKTTLFALLHNYSQQVINEYFVNPQLYDINSMQCADTALGVILNLLDNDDLIYDNYKSRYLFVKGLINQKYSYTEAINYFYQSLQLLDNTAYNYSALGNSYYNLGDFENAEINFTKASLVAPNWFYSYNNLGVLYNEQNHYQDAIKYFNMALKLNENYEISYNNRGNSYYNMGKFKEALEDYNKAISLKPTYASAYYNRGNMYLKTQNLNQALEDFNTSIKLGFDDPMVYANRGLIYYYNGDYNKAIDDYKKALEGIKDFHGVYLNLGNAYYKLKQYDNSIECYNIYLKDSVNEKIVYLNRGNCYYYQIKLPEALEDYNAAIHLDNKYADAYLNRGNVNYDLGRFQQAVNDWEHAIKLNGEFEKDLRDLINDAKRRLK